MIIFSTFRFQHDMFLLFDSWYYKPNMRQMIYYQEQMSLLAFNEPKLRVDCIF